MKRRRLLLLLPFGFGLMSSCKRERAVPNTLTPSHQTAQAEATKAKDNDTTTPHCEALSLVWSTQKDIIMEVETAHAKHEQKKQREYISAEERWWFDSDNRQWEVKRPFDPGGIDSTHWFNVQYTINGRILAAWFVDTQEKTVKISMNSIDQKGAV